MAEPEKRAKNPMAEAANHLARCNTEQEAPHKWNEAWGQLFSGAIPHEYPARIEFLENELKELPAMGALPKYGTGAPFREVDFGRYNKKGFKDATSFTNEELDEFNRTNRRSP
jgi:hypothetical protein